MSLQISQDKPREKVKVLRACLKIKGDNFANVLKEITKKEF